MDERTYCVTPEQWRHAKACLTLAKRWGLIDDDSPEALERRRAAKNAQAERAEQDGKPVYGTRRFSAPAYLQYELTRFKLDFAEPCEKIRALGICPDFTDAQTRAWYDANPDLFTRYAGDSFPYEEVKQIIEKRMREEVYDSLVQDLLRGPAQKTEHTTKTRKEIRVVVVPQMQAIIDRWGNPPGRNNFIFPVLDGTEDAMHQKLKTMYLTRAINKRMQEVGEQLGIGNISTYTARHSFATVLKRAGANIAYISESLGHQDLKTTENYLASFEREEREKNAAILIPDGWK